MLHLQVAFLLSATMGEDQNITRLLGHFMTYAVLHCFLVTEIAPVRLAKIPLKTLKNHCPWFLAAHQMIWTFSRARCSQEVI